MGLWKLPKSGAAVEEKELIVTIVPWSKIPGPIWMLVPSGKETLTPEGPTVPWAVAIGVGVAVEEGVLVTVGVFVGVKVAVNVEVRVGVGVGVKKTKFAMKTKSGIFTVANVEVEM